MRARIAEFGGVVGRPALLAVVAVLVFRTTTRTGSQHEAVGQEQLSLGVVELLHLGGERTTVGRQALVDRRRQPLVLGRVCRVVVVVLDEEPAKVLSVFLAERLDHRLRRRAGLLGGEHGRGAVGVVGADVVALVAHHALEAHPDVRLDVLEQVPQVHRAIGIRQRAGDEDAAHGGLGAEGCVKGARLYAGALRMATRRARRGVRPLPQPA